MKVTHEGSMKIYQEMAENPPMAPVVPMNPRRESTCGSGDRSQIALVKTRDRASGILEALRLLGGLERLVEGVDGEIIIKPNCNTDDPYPRDTHPETVRAIAKALITAGADPGQIVVGDMSGRFRGLPTRATVENLGIKSVAEGLGLGLAYFEEEDWVRVRPPHAEYWPDGITIPRRIYEADRVVFTPILRSHSTATFTCAMKLGVGLIDANSREWLHNGERHVEKLQEINTAYSVDLVVSDAMKMNTGHGTDPGDAMSPGVIIVSDSIVANDAVAVALMRRHGTVRVRDTPVWMHAQFREAARLGLGSPSLDHVALKTSNLAGDPSFDELVDEIRAELG
jgi:uncharacterized protein (DUF362 family)